MANYLLVYHGGSIPASEAEQAQVMQAWTNWFGQLGPALVDGGNPASQTRVIASDGSVGPAGSNPPSGYSVIKADAIDAAVALAKGCPILGSGSIEVVETVEAM
jgi:hypothetical protein